MNTDGRIEALERRHRELHQQVESQHQVWGVDHLAISALKRRKLEVKDELEKTRRAVN